jgi:hypothetical protein
MSDDGWLLKQNGRTLGLFQNRADAIRAARVATRMSEKRGQSVQVLIYDGEDEGTASLVERLVG